MRRFFLTILFGSFLVAFSGCGSGPEELFETAEFEMLQTNYPHATSLYQEIVEKYPKSELAVTAKKRLQEIRDKNL